MCLQCLTDAVKIVDFGSFAIFKSQKDHPDWPVGQYGLVECNDPFLIIPELVSDPYQAYTDEQLDAMDNDQSPEGRAAAEAIETQWQHFQAVEQRLAAQALDWRCIVDIMNVCNAVGYNGQSNPIQFFLHHICSVIRTEEQRMRLGGAPVNSEPSPSPH